MFDVKNTAAATRRSIKVKVLDLLLKEDDRARGITVVAKCDDGNYRSCHLWKYSDNPDIRLEFVKILARIKNEKRTVVFEAAGGFSPDRWFSSFEEVECVDTELQLAYLQQALQG